MFSCGLDQEYKNNLLARFAGRESLDKETFYRHYFQPQNLGQTECDELFELVEKIYQIPTGLLRPTDDINLLTGKIENAKWWRGIFHELMAGDNEFWLQEELDKKLKKYGTHAQINQIKTCNDLFLAWGGFVP
jgi:hypothetical protein